MYSEILERIENASSIVISNINFSVSMRDFDVFYDENDNTLYIDDSSGNSLSADIDYISYSDSDISEERYELVLTNGNVIFIDLL